MSSSDSAVHEEQGFLSHLIELRDRLLKMILAVGLLFLCLFWFSDEIYSALAAPLLKHLGEGQMIAIDVAAPFFIPFKLTLMLCVFLAVPYLLYQIWSFIAPGLYSHEKRLVVPLLVSSTLLFYLGVAFAYFVVFPLVFGFFTSVAPEGVTVSTDIARYLDFVITLFFAFGIAFEVPVATVLVVAVGITTPENLVKIRPYVFVAAFIIGMFLTPPDMISQTLLAIPMWLLYEVGIVFSRTYKDRIKEAGLARDRKYDEDDAPTVHSPPTPARKGNASGSAGSTSKSTAVSTAGSAAGGAAQSATSSTETTTSNVSDNNPSLVSDEYVPGSVDPDLLQTPDEQGRYRNSMTDADTDTDGGADASDSDKTQSDTDDKPSSSDTPDDNKT